MQSLKLGQIAAVGVVVGVFLHVCVVYAILDDGGNGPPSIPPGQSTAVAQQQTPGVPTRLPDRTDCAAIRNTEYRSDAERRWFLANCTGALKLEPVFRFGASG